MSDDDGVPSLGPCCGCTGTTLVRNVIMLNQRAAVPGHGWGCVVCRLPFDGAYAVLCDGCLRAWQANPATLKTACRGYPGTEGRIPIADLPPGVFDHDESVDHG